MGSIAYNQSERIDTILYLLIYPHKPMVKTRTIDLTGFNKLPAGQNMSVAVMSYSGYDIEDALMLNGASLDRGLGRCMVLKKFTCPLKKFPNGASERTAPPPAAPAEPATNAGGRKQRQSPNLQRYRVLEEDGICGVGERLAPGDVLVSERTPNHPRPLRTFAGPPLRLPVRSTR